MHRIASGSTRASRTAHRARKHCAATLRWPVLLLCLASATAGATQRADFNGDGRSDILWRHASSGGGYVWLMNGAVRVSNSALPRVADPAWNIVGSGDFDADGKADILWRHAGSGAGYLWLMNGGQRIANRPLPTVSDPNWTVAASADFNADGRTDILWSNRASGAVRLWLMSGSTPLVNAVLPSVPNTAWSVLGAGDFNRDGRADVLWRNAETGALILWFMNGTQRTSLAHLPPVANPAWSVAGLDDFNGDDRSDILWRNLDTGANTLWLMNGATRSANAALPAVANRDWLIAGTGDFNGDGRADVLWRNGVTGAGYLWLMNGAQRLSNNPLPPVSDPRWNILAPLTAASAASCSVGISAATLSPSAYQTVPLLLDTRADRRRLRLEVDVSGRGDFRPANTLSGPLPLQGSAGMLIAPPMSLLQPLSSTRPYDVRVVSCQGKTSNVLRLSQARRSMVGIRSGQPSITLDLLLKAIFTELDDPLIAGVAGQLRPGSTEATLRRLGIDTNANNEHAAALLRESFGFDVYAASTSAPATDKLLDGVAQAVQNVFDCLDPLLANPLASPASAGDQCFDVALQSVRDGIIPAISGLHDDFATAASRMASLLGGRTGTALNGYVQRIALNAQLSGYADEYAQIALRLPGVTGDPNDLPDYLGERLTQFGLERLYDAMTDGFGDFEQQVLSIIGGPDALSAIAGLSQAQIDALRTLENDLTVTSGFGDQLELSPDQWGSSDPAPPGSGMIPVPEDGASAAEVCADYPDLGAAALSLGFSSCEDYVQPFLDPAFLDSTLQPLLAQITSLAERLEALGCLSEQGADDPQCEALADQISEVLDLLLDALRNYENEGCDPGYAEFNAGANLTCIWSSLVASTGGGCPAGSRNPGWDVGGGSVCAYFSRDYLRGGSCLANYRKVFWEPLNAETCRWQDLSISLPAAYSVHKQTRNRRVLER